MIDYIKGTLVELTPTNAVIECQGVGYDINITLIDHGKLQSLTDKEVKLLVYEVIREDAWQLYGFISRESRLMFTRLIGVSGVGPNTARLIMSAMTLDQICNCIASGDDSALKSVKGIGGKTAQRIIVDLKDKINTIEATFTTRDSGKNAQNFDDALSALVMLGFSSQQSGKALRKIFASDPDLTTEQAIRQAIKLL